MDKPSTSKAAMDTEVLDLSKSSVIKSTAARQRTHEPIHVPKQGSQRTLSTADVVEQDPASLDISKTSYWAKNVHTTGKVAPGSSNHCFVKPLPKRRIDEYLLVQYRPTPIRVKHRVIRESDVVPITAIDVKEADPREVFVSEGENMYPACVLTRNKSKDILISEMDTVRSKISAVIGLTYLRPEDVDEDAVTRPEGNPWILIQYSADRAECSHTIMRYEDSLFCGENPYPGYQVLTVIDGNYHHSLIIFRSHNYQEVLSTLHNVFDSCVISIYPHFNDMSFRQEGLKKYQRPDLFTTGTGVVGEVCGEDLEIGNQVANYVGAEASAMNKLYDQIKGAEEKMATTLKELKNLNKNDG